MGLDIAPKKKASVTIVFATPADAVAWFEDAQSKGLLQSEAGLFVKDGIDNAVRDGAGVPSRNELIVRRSSDRGYGRVTSQTVTTLTTKESV